MSEIKSNTARVISRPQASTRETYLLCTASMKKTVKTESGELQVGLEHQHVFYPRDAEGRIQSACAAVGNHFHEVQIINMPDGSIITHCSPAKVWVYKLVDGKRQRVVEDCKKDQHTHELKKI